MVVIGVLILLYLSGPFVRDKALEEYANGEQQLVVA